MRLLRRLCVFAVLITVAWGSSPAVERMGSKTVVGPNNPLLAEGAAALEAGRLDLR
jgi:hypothetical protein